MQSVKGVIVMLDPVEATKHILFQKLAVVAGIILIVDAIYSMKKFPTNNKYIKAFRWLRLIIGAGNIIVDGFIFLPAYGVNLLG